MLQSLTKSNKVFAAFGHGIGADHEVLVGLAREESAQASIDLAPCLSRCNWVSAEDPDSRESRVIITLVLDGVGSVVCVDDLCAGRGWHVWHTVVRRCGPVHARAISFTKACEILSGI